ncbi:MAG: MMPL family transporter, partial [Candidatus Sericytochromatia bacterium]|nr:MMPL family transporter [Candidatus Tanganyikabacteria bacterium]
MFAALGRFVYRHRLAVVIAWVVMVAIGSAGARLLPDRLFEGSSEIAGSDSQKMEHTLREQFANPYTRLHIVAVTSKLHTVEDETYRQWIRDLTDAARRVPEVAEVTTYLDLKDKRLRSPDGHNTALMVGMRQTDLHGEQKAVPAIRSAIKPVKERILAADPGANIALTGRAAILYDIDSHMKHDGEKAESRALPISMVILVFAFGALVAAGIPLAIAMVGITVAMGLGCLLTLVMPVSAFIVNAVTMIGLAIGIDYALLMVNRYRKALEARPDAPDAVEEAIVETVETAGHSVVFSGLAVMISLSALYIAPLVEFQSMGLGATFVVVSCVLAALTLAPAIMGFVGRRIDAPRWMSSRMRMPGREEWWHRVANWVMDRPWRVLLTTVAFVLALGAPAIKMDTGFSNSRWFPMSFECRQGIEILGPLQQYNAVIPIFAVIRAPEGQDILQTRYIPRLFNFARELQKDDRVGSILSPVTLRDDLGLMQYLMLYRNADSALERFPQIEKLLLSRDRNAALFQIVASNSAKLRDTMNLSADIARKSPGGDLKLEVGGEPAYYIDFEKSMQWAFPQIIAVVVSVTLVVLFLAFRSFLLPIKAVLMNLLSVGAGYGVVVAVFQFGWGHQL